MVWILLLLLGIINALLVMYLALAEMGDKDEDNRD